jgi:hypothetical protein
MRKSIAHPTVCHSALGYPKVIAQSLSGTESIGLEDTCYRFPTTLRWEVVFEIAKGSLLCLTYLKCDPIIGFVVFGMIANSSE